MVKDSASLRAEYPFQSHFLKFDGLEYHYLDEGRGEPVIMLHGNPSWSFYYRHLVRELRPDYRVVVPDHMGCGLSSKPADSQYEFSLEQRIRDLDRLIEALDLGDNLTLVMHDWGGMIGMAWAVRNPGRVARLVLMNTAAFHLPAAKKLPPALKLCRETQFGAFLVQGLNAFCPWRGLDRLSTKTPAAGIAQALLQPLRQLEKPGGDVALCPGYPPA